MKHTDWLLPNRKTDPRFEALCIKVHPAFREALREYAEHETARTGKTISQATILSTLSLQGDARLRRLVKHHQNQSTPSS